MPHSKNNITDLEELSLSTRAITLLDKQLNIRTVAELLEYRRQFASADEFKQSLLKIRGFGVAIVNEIENAIKTIDSTMSNKDKKQVATLNTRIDNYKSKIAKLQEEITKTINKKTLLITQTIKRRSK